MKTTTSRHPVLGLLGLASLTVYILACTSFSPDDSKVLYPVYDPQAQDFGVGLFDRKTGKTITLFVPQQPPLDDSKREYALLRPQWLADGRHILAGWGRGSDDDGLDLAVLPYGQAGPTRLIHLKDLPEGFSQLAAPLAIAQGQLFLGGRSNVLVRVNLLTGEVNHRVMPRAVTPWASPTGDRLFYLSEVEGAATNLCEFGLLNPANWGLTPITRLHLRFHPTNPDRVLCAISPDGQRVVLAGESGGDEGHVILFENGREQRRWRPFPENDTVKIGGLALSPLHRTAYASYLWQPDGATNASLGILEFPLAGGEPRRTSLIQRAQAEEGERVRYFQPTVSHDGKTLAVSSTYVAAGDKVMAEKDCALFLVNLADPKRGVTRVPVPRPPQEMD